MFITDADVLKALSLCERTASSSTGDFRRVCREGVFMQIYQPLEPDDFLMLERMKVKPTKETVRAYCALFEDDAYEGACLRESWPYIREDILERPGSIDAFCSGQPNQEEEDACYDTALSVLGRQTLGQPDRASAACAGVSEVKRSECYARVALSYLEESRSEFKPAIDFCTKASGAYSEECLLSLSQRAQFVFGADVVSLQRFCSRLPLTARGFCTSLESRAF